MKSSSIYLMLCLCCFLFACNSDPKPEASTSKKIDTTSPKTIIIEKISSADFAKKLAANKDAQLIDVRTPQEFNQGHLEHALNLNYHGDYFIEELRKLDKNKPLFIYCQSGGRSGKACFKLKKMGFTEVYDLEGGYLDWQEQQ